MHLSIDALRRSYDGLFYSCRTLVCLTKGSVWLILTSVECEDVEIVTSHRFPDRTEAENVTLRMVGNGLTAKANEHIALLTYLEAMFLESRILTTSEKLLFVQGAQRLRGVTGLDSLILAASDSQSESHLLSLLDQMQVLG